MRRRRSVVPAAHRRGSPSTRRALNYLGYMLAERGERLDESVELIQRALEARSGQRLVSRQPGLGAISRAASSISRRST